MLGDDFVHQFNNHRVIKFNLGGVICVDKSTIQQHSHEGLDKLCIANYVTIDRKIENWLEIQNSAYGDSDISMPLLLAQLSTCEEKFNDDALNGA